jgi:hypothetical protein
MTHRQDELIADPLNGLSLLEFGRLQQILYRV